MKIDDDTTARLSEIDALVARANEIALSVRQDILTRSERSPVAQQGSLTVDTTDENDLQARTLLERRLEERSREIATLTALVRDLEAESKDATEKLKWYGKILVATLARPAKWGMMPASWHILKERRRLAKAGLFDGGAYLRRYPDVATSRMDPLVHYVEHGISEGRQR